MSLLQGHGVPKIHCLVRRSDKGSDKEYNFLVMEKLDQEDLEDKFQESKRDFSLNKLIMLADKMIETIEIIHEKGILHNDLKPNNMSMGIDAKISSQLYIIDFGLCKPWREPDGSHIKYQGMYSFFYFLSTLGLAISARPNLPPMHFCFLFSSILFNIGVLFFFF